MATKGIFYQQRSSMLKKLLILGTAITCLLAMLNFFASKPQIGWFQLAASLTGMVIIYHYSTWVTAKNIQAVSVFFATLLLSLILYAVNLPSSNKLVYLWVFAVPLIAYNTAGVFYGFMLTALFVSASIISIIRIENFDLQQFSYNQSDALICLLVIWVLTHFSEQVNATSKQKLTRQATKDPLTKLYNRYALQEIFDRQKHHRISMIILDIDFFKQINDTHGHDGGDFVLKKISKLLSNSAPETASVFRLGGEEFGILLPNYTLDDARDLANDILETMRVTQINYNDEIISITASAGISNSKLKRDLGELMKSADKCLYKAKQTGRDKVLAC